MRESTRWWLISACFAIAALAQLANAFVQTYDAGYKTGYAEAQAELSE